VNLNEREEKHNSGKGAKYTRSRRPVKIMYCEEFSSLVETRRREAQVKKWSKVKKERLAQGKRSSKSSF